MPVSRDHAERIAQLLLVGFRGMSVEGNAELHHLVGELKIGGVILFHVDWTANQGPRNLGSPEQGRALAEGLQALARGARVDPLLVATDNEGGQVVRVPPPPGAPPFPSHAALGKRNEVGVTEQESRRLARALRETGVNWNLAPVVDLALDPDNGIVKAGRCFGDTPETVTAHARAFLRGHRAEGILTALKHFPGHGSSREDSHHGFVDVSETARPDLERAPYRRLVTEGLLDSVMTAHVFDRRVDPRFPATLSRTTIGTLRGGAFGFDGVVLSDDLQMGAITGRYGTEEGAILALQAGVDMLLLSNNWDVYDPGLADRVHAAILRAVQDGRLDSARIEAAYRRVLALKSRLPR